MALREQGLLIAIVCGVGVLAAGTLGVIAYRAGPMVTSEVCADCGLFRTRTGWRVPKTPLGVGWRSAISNSAVSVAIRDHDLAREWGHRWLIYDEIRPPPPAPARMRAPAGSAAKSSGVFSPRPVAATPPRSAPAGSQRQPGRCLVYQYNSPEVAEWVVALHHRSDRKTISKWMRWLADPHLSPHVLGTAVRFCLQREQLKEPQDFQRWLEDEEEKLVFGNRPQKE